MVFLVACSSKTPAPIDPATVEHTVSLSYNVNWISQTDNGPSGITYYSLTPAMYRPALTVNFAANSSPAYAIPRQEYTSPTPGSNTFNPVPIGKYKGDETITLTLFLAGHSSYKSTDYPHGYTITAFLVVDGKTQNPGFILSDGYQGTWDPTTFQYTKTFVLKSQDVVK